MRACAHCLETACVKREMHARNSDEHPGTVKSTASERAWCDHNLRCCCGTPDAKIIITCFKSGFISQPTVVHCLSHPAFSIIPSDHLFSISRHPSRSAFNTTTASSQPAQLPELLLLLEHSTTFSGSIPTLASDRTPRICVFSIIWGPETRVCVALKMALLMHLPR